MDYGPDAEGGVEEGIVWRFVVIVVVVCSFLLSMKENFVFFSHVVILWGKTMNSYR